MVTCTVSPLSRFTAHLLPVYLIVRIFHFCRNENFCYRYLRFYWKKWFYIWYMALAWWLVQCLPFPGLPHICFPFTVRLEFFMFAVIKTFVTVISASTGRNDLIFLAWWLVPCPLSRFTAYLLPVYSATYKWMSGGILSTT